MKLCASVFSVVSASQQWLTTENTEAQSIKKQERIAIE